MKKDRFIHYTTNIESMDAEHWAILHVLDLIYTAIQDNDLLLIKSLSLNLNHLLDKHYNSEERYMHSIDYPFIKYHASEHIILKKEMDHIIHVISTMYTVSPITADWLVKKLDKLLIGHIDEHDMQYAKFAAINK